MLGHGQNYPAHAGEAARGEEDGPGGGPGRPREEEHPEEAVDPHLDHDARHQRRDVAGGRWVGAGQPDVEGHEARLAPEARQRQEEDRPVSARRELRGGEVRKAEGGGARTPKGEKRQQRRRAEVRGHRVSEPVPPDLLLFMVLQHQQEGGHRHALPGHEEEEPVGSQDEQRHAEDQEEVEGPGEGAPSRGGAVLHVAAAVDREGHREEEHEGEEEGRERVEPERQAPPRHRPGGGPRELGAAEQDAQGWREAQEGGEPRGPRGQRARPARSPPAQRSHQRADQERGESGQGQRGHGHHVPPGSRPSILVKASMRISRPACFARWSRKGES